MISHVILDLICLYSNAKEESCFFPVPQAAECILRVAAKSNAPVIYLSTDAASSETDVLQSLLALDGRSIPLIKRPAHNSVEKWDALLYRNHLGEDNQVKILIFVFFEIQILCQFYVLNFRLKRCWIRRYVPWRVCL